VILRKPHTSIPRALLSGSVAWVLLAEGWSSFQCRLTPCTGPAGDQGHQEGAAAQGEGHGGDGGLAGAAKKVGDLLLGGRGRLTSATLTDSRR